MSRFTVFLFCAGVALSLAAPEGRAYEVNRKKNEIKLSSLEDFTKCMRDYGDYQSQFCLDGLTAFIKGHKNDAFEAGKLVRLNMRHWAAIPFFETALGTAKLDQFCKEEDVHLSVVSALGLPPGDKNENKLIKAAQTIAFEKCWNDFKGLVDKELEGNTGYFKDNACAQLKTKHIAQKTCDAPAVAAAKPDPDAVDPEVLKLGGADFSKLEIAETGVKVFKGDEGRKITIVQVQPEGSNRVLIKFDGFKGPWNGKTLLHFERSTGHNKADFVALVDGKAWVSVTKRDSWGSASYEVYPKGDTGSYQVGYSEDQSEKASARAILKDFKSEAKRSVAGH